MAYRMSEWKLLKEVFCKLLSFKINKLCQILPGILLTHLFTAAQCLSIISLERTLEYNISSVSPKYLLGQEEI